MRIYRVHYLSPGGQLLHTSYPLTVDQAKGYARAVNGKVEVAQVGSFSPIAALLPDICNGEDAGGRCKKCGLPMRRHPITFTKGVANSSSNLNLSSPL